MFFDDLPELSDDELTTLFVEKLNALNDDLRLRIIGLCNPETETSWVYTEFDAEIGAAQSWNPL